MCSTFVVHVKVHAGLQSHANCYKILKIITNAMVMLIKWNLNIATLIFIPEIIDGVPKDENQMLRIKNV